MKVIMLNWFINCFHTQCCWKSVVVLVFLFFLFIFFCLSVILLIKCSSVSQFTHFFSVKWTIVVN